MLSTVERTSREDVRKEGTRGRADSELLHRLVDSSNEGVVLILDLVAVRHHEDDSTSGPARTQRLSDDQSTTQR